ncbi:MAG: hypothetical protein LYZ66_02115 [Nitrososphaerales archaeon]|nr:hypothetical protein [Nitrososphaerales archaeon]
MVRSGKIIAFTVATIAVVVAVAYVATKAIPCPVSNTTHLTDQSAGLSCFAFR